MAAKPNKIDDVKPPEKVKAAPTSRPILVTNRPILPNDPMMVPADDGADKPEVVPITRTAKTIKPIDNKLTTTAETEDSTKASAAKAEPEPAEPVFPAAQAPDTKTAEVVPTSLLPPLEPSTKTEAPITESKEALGTAASSEPPSTPELTLEADDDDQQAVASEEPDKQTDPEATTIEPQFETKESEKPAATDEVEASDQPVTDASAVVNEPETSDDTTAKPGTASAPQLPSVSGSSVADSKPGNLVPAAPSETRQTAATDIKAETKSTADTPAPGMASDEPKRDAEAEISADEAAAMAARAAREAELEQLVASGKYYVPINAVQRKRSRMYTILLFLLAVALAALLFDAVLDADLVHVSVNVPHTHFFSGH